MTQDNNNNGGAGGFISSLFSNGSGNDNNQNNYQERTNNNAQPKNDMSEERNRSVKITKDSLETTRKVLDPKESTKEAVHSLSKSFLNNFGIVDQKSVDSFSEFVSPFIEEHAVAIKKYHDAAKDLFNSVAGPAMDGNHQSHNPEQMGDRKIAHNEEDNDQEMNGRKVASNQNNRFNSLFNGHEDDDNRNA